MAMHKSGGKGWVGYTGTLGLTLGLKGRVGPHSGILGFWEASEAVPFDGECTRARASRLALQLAGCSKKIQGDPNLRC